jgi:hypothetical protein
MLLDRDQPDDGMKHCADNVHHQQPYDRVTSHVRGTGNDGRDTSQPCRSSNFTHLIRP